MELTYKKYGLVVFANPTKELTKNQIAFMMDNMEKLQVFIDAKETPNNLIPTLDGPGRVKKYFTTQESAEAWKISMLANGEKHDVGISSLEIFDNDVDPVLPPLEAMQKFNAMLISNANKFDVAVPDVACLKV
jgi:hypothetical protein